MVKYIIWKKRKFSLNTNIMDAVNQTEYKKSFFENFHKK